MTQNTRSKNSVGFFDDDKFFSTDSDPDLSISQETLENGSNISNTKVTAGDTGSNSSCTDLTLTHDEHRKTVSLTHKATKLEARCKVLEKENEKFAALLNVEKRKNEKLERKLQFVRDNQEVFMKLKEAYVNMKYNEATGRKMIEIREKAMQTWEGILCKNCIESEEIRREAEEIRKEYCNAFILTPENIQQLETTILYLKDVLQRREKAWSLNMEREDKFRGQIAGLTDENKALKELLKKKYSNVENPDYTEVETLKSNIKVVENLRKIIVKYEKRFRDMMEKRGRDSGAASPLNEREQIIVENLMDKYVGRLKQKSNTSNSVHRTKRLEKRSHSLPIDNSMSKCSSGDSLELQLKKLDNNGANNCRSQKSENAILMLDSLFDSESNTDVF